MRLSELATLLGCPFQGPAELGITHLCDPHVRDQEGLLFVENPEKGVPEGAGAYLVPASHKVEPSSHGPGWIFSGQPRRSFMACLEHFNPRPSHREARLSPVPPDCAIGSGVYIGPGVTLHADCRIGDACVLMGHNYLGPGVRLGRGVVLHPGVVIEWGCRVGDDVVIHANTVIGSDGFGYESTPQGHRKIPQVGVVEIGDGVEIGSNASIDRATVGATRIGAGSKIDNLVQVAHNVQLGEGCILAGQSGVAGSSRLGRFVVLAGQAGVSDHAELGDGAILTAQAGVVSRARVEAGAVLGGSPAIPLGEHKRLFVYLRRLPQLFKNSTNRKDP